MGSWASFCSLRYLGTQNFNLTFLNLSRWRPTIDWNILNFCDYSNLVWRLGFFYRDTIYNIVVKVWRNVRPRMMSVKQFRFRNLFPEWSVFHPSRRLEFFSPVFMALLDFLNFQTIPWRICTFFSILEVRNNNLLYRWPPATIWKTV